MATDREKWLVSRRKRSNRDIRDFIPVHGKILKPSPPSRQGDGEGKTKKRAPLAKPRWERHNNNKVPATAFSTGVRRKVPLRAVHENSSCPVNCSSWEENQQEGKVDKERLEYNRKRVRDKENKVLSLPQKRTAKKHSGPTNSPALFSPSLLTTVVASTPLSSESHTVDRSPSPSLLHSSAHSPPLLGAKSPADTSPSLLHSSAHSPPFLGINADTSPSLLHSNAHSPPFLGINADTSPSLLNAIAPTPQPSRSIKTIVPPSVLNTIPSTPLTLGYKSPPMDPTPSPSLLRTKHTVTNPSPFPPITTVTTFPGKHFPPPDNGNPSNNEPPDEEYFDCPLSCLSPETRALIAELETCEKLCDRLLNLT